MGVIIAGLGALGVWMLYDSRRPGSASRRHRPPPAGDLLARAGVPAARLRELATVTAAAGAGGGALGYMVFGGVLAAAVSTVVAGVVPVTALRARQRSNDEEARRAWPRMIEEIRLQTAGLGRSIPQALFEVGRRGPAGMREAFWAAERQWLVSTDFARTVDVLKAGLADPTADAVCENLLVAHEIGGGNLDRHLAALVQDRLLELDGRRDALAKQAGARFARRFVLLVPVGMALAGLSIGDGRASYETPGGQLAVVTGVLAVLVCWWWAGRLMRLPEQQRVFR